MNYEIKVNAKVAVDDIFDILKNEDSTELFISKLYNDELYDYMTDEDKKNILSYFDDEILTDEVGIRANYDYKILQTFLDNLNDNTKKELNDLLKDE